MNHTPYDHESDWLIAYRLLLEQRPYRLRHQDGPTQVGIGEANNEELVGVGDLVSVGIGDGWQEVVVVRDPEGVKPRASRIDKPSILAGMLPALMPLAVSN